MNHTRVTFNDPIFVKQLERRLGRKLQIDEILKEEMDGSIALYFRTGREFVVIPKVVYPDDLLSRAGLDIIELLDMKNDPYYADIYSLSSTVSVKASGVILTDEDEVNIDENQIEKLFDSYESEDKDESI